LSFVKGVVDSEDLPLNISRETLQENVIFNKISSSVTSQVLSFLADMAKNEKEKYAEFWKEHGKIFKLGYMDFTNQEKWADLLRFNSSTCNDEKELVSLQEYVDRKKDKQKEIYYVLGNSRQAINSDPHLEIFKSKGIEVFYLYDPIDEIAISSLNKYKDFDIKSVDQADLSKIEKMDDVVEKKDESEKLTKDDEKHFDSLMSKMKEILGEKVKEVRESKRLKDSPAVLVNPDNSMSGSMQKIMQIMNKDQSIPEKIMEVNKNHPLMRNLLKIFKADSNDNYITDVVKQLYESALLLEGYLQDPHELVGRINKLLNQSSDWYTSVKKI
jgi:molecular chaperone HtpG